MFTKFKFNPAHSKSALYLENQNKVEKTVHNVHCAHPICQKIVGKAIHFMRDGKNNALHELIIFVSSSPSQGDIFFFLKSDINGLLHVF